MKCEITKEHKTFFVASCEVSKVEDGELVTSRAGLATYSWTDREKFFTSDPNGGDKFDSFEKAKQAANDWFSRSSRPKYYAADIATLQIVKIEESFQRCVAVVTE